MEKFFRSLLKTEYDRWETPWWYIRRRAVLDTRSIERVANGGVVPAFWPAPARGTTYL